MAQRISGISYDEVLYPSNPYPQTHPDRLATMATLLGLEPPNPAHCRVIEIGCASGGNIIPMALSLPESRFLGIDLSSKQIETGKRTIDALGLTNIEVRAANILDIDGTDGPFDYVIAHGIFSWVSVPVRERLLDLCRDLLAANGVAYVSYNTLPGWHMRGMIREMMCYHISQFPGDPRTQVAQARGLLEFLTRSCPPVDPPYRLFLQQELDMVRQRSDDYLLHDHLEEWNEPVYFFEFNDQLVARGLRYLGDADFTAMLSSQFEPEVQKELRRIAPDLIQMEQYMDFLLNRTFRQSLVCHETVVPDYNPKPELMKRFRIASSARPVSARPKLQEPTVEEFQTSSGAELKASEPIFKAAMICLTQVWPRFLGFEELRRQARALLDPGRMDDEELAARDRQALCTAILASYAGASNHLIELSLCPPRVGGVAERPTASRLTRLQVTNGNQVTTLRHQVWNLSDFERHLVSLLDGTRDLTELCDLLERDFIDGRLAIDEKNRTVVDHKEARVLIRIRLEKTLENLAGGSVLME